MSALPPESGHGLTTDWMEAKRRNLRARPLISNVDLLGNCERIVHFNPEVMSRALDLPVTKKELDGS